MVTVRAEVAAAGITSAAATVAGVTAGSATVPAAGSAPVATAKSAAMPAAEATPTVAAASPSTAALGERPGTAGEERGERKCEKCYPYHRTPSLPAVTSGSLTARTQHAALRFPGRGCRRSAWMG